MQTSISAFLVRIGEVPKRWGIHAEQERPDFVLTTPDGNRIGLEMTELVTSDFGKLRKAERLVCTVVQDEVAAFIESLGVPGAFVMGNNQSIAPPDQLRLDELRGGLRTHLQTYGQGLKAPNGSMKVPFEHDWGRVTSIHRSSILGVSLTIDRHDHSPLYQETDRPLTEIESAVLDRIKNKATKAKGYSTEYPLWLAIRNPSHEQIGRLSDACLAEARRLNEGRFARIVLFNDPEHVLDASPPPPHCVEIF
jgi:hypothetical protein